MKVFLQNGLTREFLRAPDEWTPVAARAMEFDDSAAVIQYCLDHELRNMRVVLHFPEYDYDVHLPVSVPDGRAETLGHTARPESPVTHSCAT